MLTAAKSNITPLELKWIAERKARRERLGAGQIKPMIVTRKVEPEIVKPAVEPVEDFEKQFAELWRMASDFESPLPEFDLEASFKRVKFGLVLKEVAKYYGHTTEDLCSAIRTPNVVKPRQIAAYLGRRLTYRSLPELGRRLGGRDHTTIYHAYTKIQRLLQTDAELRSEVSSLIQTIEGV